MAEFIATEAGAGAGAANGLTKTTILPAGLPVWPKGGDAKALQGGARLYENGHDQAVVRPGQKFCVRLRRGATLEKRFAMASDANTLHLLTARHGQAISRIIFRGVIVRPPKCFG